MTIASTTSKLLYNGDGSTTVFPISFVFWQAGDIRVIHRDASGAETVWAEGTHYTVSGGSGGTGSLTVLTAPVDHTPQAGEKLLIKSDIAELQPAALPLGGAFPSTTVEQMVDIATRLIQQHSEQIARSVLLPETSSLAGLRLPEPGAGELIRYNAGGTGLEAVALGDLGTAIDTVLSGPNDGDALVFDAAQSAWVNRASDFKVSQQSPAGMTVRVSAGTLYDVTTRTRVSKAAQNSAGITAPTTNPRIDVVHIDALTGAVGIATGAEAASPISPALADGLLPLAEISLATSTTKITSAEITDIRELANIGAIPEARQFVDVASAATAIIGAAPSGNVRITGTTAITAFDSAAAGLKRYVRFADALTLTHKTR